MQISLLQKLLALFLGIFVLAAGGLTYFAYLTSRDAMRIEFLIRGRTLTKAIASESRLYYQRADVEGFTTLLQALGETEGVLAVLAYRESRALWVETSIIELTPEELTLPGDLDEFEQEKTLAKQHRVAEFMSPIFGEVGQQRTGSTHAPVGWIRVMVDRRGLETRLGHLVTRTILFGGSIVLTGALAFTYLLRRSLRIIGPLTEATRTIARGDLRSRVPVTGTDELGELARCFNLMTEQLIKTTVSKQYLDNIIRSLIDTLIVMNPDGTIRMTNQAALTLLGYDERDLVGHAMDRVFPPRGNPLMGLTYHELLTKGALDHIETHYLTKQGHVVPVVLSLVVMRAEDGDVQGIACVAKDVTEMRQAQERLRLQGAALEAAANAVAITDQGGDITWVNPAFETLTGYEPKEAIGQNMRMLKSYRHDQAFYQRLWDTIVAGQVWQGEVINRRKDGSLYTEEETITPVLDHRGAITHFIAIKQDVTDRKRAEEALLQAHLKLTELDRLRSQFFADISHELRTPLTVIRGEAEVTLRGKDKPVAEYKTVLERIVGLTAQLNKLVADLLFLARSESGTLEISKQPTSLFDILKEVHREAQVLATRQGTVATLAGPTEPFLVNGDPQRLRQLFMTLVDNAVNYSQAGGAIEILALKRGTHVTVMIADNGMGIPADDLPHVFERFYRVKRRHKPTLHTGSGLGLPIAKWIAEAHEGTISIASLVGEGTTVTVQLPLDTAANHPKGDTTGSRRSLPQPQEPGP